MSEMFCYQCQETAGGKGCTTIGTCGKTPNLAAVQDLLVFATKGLASITTRLREENKFVEIEADHLITKNLFMTNTNTNYDKSRIVKQIVKTVAMKKSLLSRVSDTSTLSDAAFWVVSDKMDRHVKSLGVLYEKDEDRRGLIELVTYGLKGLAAYMVQANALSFEDENIDAFIQRSLSKLLDNELKLGALINLAMETGRYTLMGMSLLDRANTGKYGTPTMKKVPVGVRKKPGILVSGHNLRDLEMLLDQSASADVDIYTHSEMLPAHFYPLLNQHINLVGNYGSSWRRQGIEFEKFHGPILMTTNCFIPPTKKYKYRFWTTGVAGMPGCRHIAGEYGKSKDFSQIIEQAQHCSPPEPLDSESITGGFAHKQVSVLSDLLVKGIKDGKIRTIVVMAGCDGRSNTRQYYTEFAMRLPEDSVILTAGCAKYRYNKLDLGKAGGFPRILDAGQCNDIYSIILIILNLQKLLNVRNLNDLPIIFNLSWHGQKTVSILLALLHLRFKNIHLGPTLPAFLPPDIVEILSGNLGLSGIGTAKEDVRLFLEKTKDRL